MWAAFVLVICLLPPSNIPKSSIPHLDKAVHFTSYFILASLLYFGWTKQASLPSLKQQTIIKILVLAAVYGLSIEIAQSYVGRSFDWWDELTNVCGAVVGCIAAIYIMPRLRTGT